MREHPDYKYRPRRKPKPLMKKEGVAKFPLPLHFFPPGFDPASAALAARSFFPAHFGSSLLAATPLATPKSPTSFMAHLSELEAKNREKLTLTSEDQDEEEKTTSVKTRISTGRNLKLFRVESIFFQSHSGFSGFYDWSG